MTRCHSLPYIKHRATSSNVPATQEGNVVELPQDTSPTTADHETSLSSEKSSVTTGENLEEIDPSEESLTSTSSKTSTTGHIVKYVFFLKCFYRFCSV